MKTILSKTLDYFFHCSLNKNTKQCSPCPEKETYVFFKVIPFADSDKEVTILTGGLLRQALYKPKSLKSLATALEQVEEAGIQLLKDTAPQNIFLVFGEHPEALYHAIFSLPIAPERFVNPRTSPFPAIPLSPHEDKLEYKSVIFCKLKGTPKVFEFFGLPEQKQEDSKWIYSLNWLDFFNLKEKQDKPFSASRQE